MVLPVLVSLSLSGSSSSPTSPMEAEIVVVGFRECVLREKTIETRTANSVLDLKGQAVCAFVCLCVRG
uniref:Putative secreted protein n=1 Tax=Anopheles darlingi TaxID=43151 RepID=A0A2M4D389_ANODA